MKYFTGFILVLTVLSACSPTENLIEEAEQEIAEEIASPAPPWYRAAVQSSADSHTFHGYSMASAYDSENADALARDTATNNLRFEIDRLAEETRRNLADTSDGTEYISPSFMIQLRNAVRNMELSGTEIELQTDYSDEGIYYTYARATITIESAAQQLAIILNDPGFIYQMLNQ